MHKYRFTTIELLGTAPSLWAMTKDDTEAYNKLFKTWDIFHMGFLKSDISIKVMRQSGLPKEDLENIWTLSNPGNKRKMERNEFAVAIHLIHRTLNGYPAPNQLPPNLISLLTRKSAESIDTVKSLQSQDAETRENLSAFIKSQPTRGRNLNKRSFPTDSYGTTLRYKNAPLSHNDIDDVEFKSRVGPKLCANSPRSTECVFAFV